MEAPPRPGSATPDTGLRWYLAPDGAKPREFALEAALEKADVEVDRVSDHVVEQRQEEERHEAERKEERQRGDEERQQRQKQEQELFRQFLAEREPSTVKEIAAGGKGQRFTLEPSGGPRG